MALKQALIACLATGLLPIVTANINFVWVTPKCHPTDTYNHCLRGQHCEHTTCTFDRPAIAVYGNQGLEKRQAVAPRADGTCGPANGNAPCDPAGAYGGCCSQYGYCGSTDPYCLVSNGCISGCRTSSTTTTTIITSKVPAPSGSASPAPVNTTDGSCGSLNKGALCGNWPQGSCCSQYGYCGNDAAHCGTGCQSGCTTAPPPTGPVNTTDGTCGSLNNGALCGNWPQGGCCSQYGYCGNDAAHCGTGCQSGPCTSPSPVPSPSPSPSPSSTKTTTTTTTSPLPTTSDKLTTDGSCGANFGNTVCGNWPQGSCCSMYGYCGADTAHCGDGCQSGPCTGPANTPAPGPKPAPANPNPGNFAVIGQSGVPPMHAGLLPNGQVFFLDKVENYTQLKLASGYYAYSSEYNPSTNKAVALSYKTNAFCSGGSPLADGRIVNMGGNAPLTDIDPTVGNGFTALRYLSRLPSNAALNGQAWSEPGSKLTTARWYPTAQMLPDGTIFVASGSLNGLDPSVAANNNPTYEMLDKSGNPTGKSIRMDILVATQPYYMYPFIHLLNTGDLFIFAAKSSQIFNVASNKTVKSLPALAGDYRTYPNTGGSVMLPLSKANGYNPDIIICGGGPYQDINAPTDASCGRIQPLSTNPAWELDAMPMGRVMIEGNLLLDGTVVWLNGAGTGAQGFGLSDNAVFQALIYNPSLPLGQRWLTDATSTIARVYHSVSLMLPDGTILVAGSNPVQQPILAPDPQDPYVTEFRVERYTPPYLQGAKANSRPTLLNLSTSSLTPGGSNFLLSFFLPNATTVKTVQIVLYLGGFVTHSVHMGHRMVYCEYTGYVKNFSSQLLNVTPPPNHNVVPPGYYLLFVVADGVPSIGKFVLIK